MRAIIIGNGQIDDYQYIQGKIRKGDYIMCADGGYRHTKKLGVTPDVLVGDMDSISDNDYKGEIINLPIRKDYTDSEVCVKYAIIKGFEEIIMLGFTGTRQDHTITNLFLLKQIYDNEKKGKIIDDHNEITYLEKHNVIHGKKGDIVSVVPCGTNLTKVTTNGLDYPLNEETLIFGESRGVSNIMTSNKCEITVESGIGLIIKSRD